MKSSNQKSGQLFAYKNHRIQILRFLAVCLSLFMFRGFIAAESENDIPIKTTRISDRVLVLQGTFMTNNVIALAGEKGIAVVDSTGIPSTMKVMRKIIEKEFGRNDFIYLINTHHHWDHTYGNQIFPEAQVVAHISAKAPMEQIRIIEFSASFQNRLNRAIEELKAMPPDSTDRAGKQAEIDEFKRIVRDYEGFIPCPPEQTFDDRMGLELGGLSLNLIFFGRAHSGSDIFIHIPEERLLLTGDIFLDGRWLPLFAGQEILDIPRWLDVLNGLLENTDNIRQVIPGHQHFWTKARLVLWRDYITDLWDEVQVAKTEKRNVDDIPNPLLINPRFDYLKELGHTEDELKQYHARNIRAFRNQLFEPAASVLEKAINDQGLEKAENLIEDICRKRDLVYHVSEGAFNALGYRYLQARRIPEALTIFRLNTTFFPESWNTHDSLGEALHVAQDYRSAYESYTRSLKLNPANDNGRLMLDSLGGTLSDMEAETNAPPRFPPKQNTGLLGPYLGQEPPGLEPKIFAPGIISTAGNFEFSCTFSPDGKEFYFTRRKDGSPNNIIYVTHLMDDGWAAPAPAPFNGKFGGNEPHITPDGNKLYFGSSRPLPESGETTYAIWEMDRTNSGWSEPRHHGSGMYVSVTNDGTMYLTEITVAFKIGRKHLVDGVYGAVEILEGPVNSPVPGVHPCISPDESYMIFDSRRPGGQGGEGDLYVCFRNPDGSWSEAVNLGDQINTKGTNFCAALSPDGKYIFYETSRDIYWVSAQILDSLRPQ